MLVIRLARVGKKKQPEYRIVVADRRRATRGRFVDIVGYYSPITDPATLRMDRERVKEWLEKGAQPSETVTSLIRHVEEDEPIKNKPRKKKEQKAVKAAASETEPESSGEAKPEGTDSVPEEAPVTEEGGETDTAAETESAEAVTTEETPEEGTPSGEEQS